MGFILSADELARYQKAATDPSLTPDVRQDSRAVVSNYLAAADLVVEAKRAGKTASPAVSDRVASLLAIAEKAHNRLRQPVGGVATRGWHSGGLHGPDDAGGRKDRFDHGGPRLLTKDQSVAEALGHDDVDDAEAFGGLGVIFKAMTSGVDHREYERYMGAYSGTKDMLESGSAAVIVPAPISSQVIDLLRARVVVVQLGARTVPMSSKTLTVPRITADPSASWLDEGATITPGDGTLDGVTLTARRLTALTKVSDELAEDSEPELVGQVLANSLARSFAVELDRVALRGSGTPPEPEGLLTNDAVTKSPQAGAAATWSMLAAMRATILAGNSDVTGYVMHPTTLSAVEDALSQVDGQFVQPPASLANIPRLPTSNVDDTEIYAGNWADLYVGLRVGFELRTLVERYAEEGKIGVRARMRADVQVAHGASFHVNTEVGDSGS